MNEDKAFAMTKNVIENDQKCHVWLKIEYFQ